MNLDWEKTICIEMEKRMIPRKLLEGSYIKANRNVCMNSSDGFGTSAQYGEGKGAWIRRGSNKRRGGECHKVPYSSTA
jgi:hypothetical protein